MVRFCCGYCGRWPQRLTLIFSYESDWSADTSEPEILPRASALGAEEASVHALDHVVVQTADPDAAKILYGEKLGLRLALDREFPQWHSRMLFFRVGGATVEVVAGAGGSADEQAPAADRDRLSGLCWRVGDAEAARARLAEEGFDVSEVRPGRKPGTRVFTLRDGSCGIPTLILEAGPAGPAGQATGSARG